MGKRAHEALVDVEHDEQVKAKLIEDWGVRPSPTEELQINRQIFLEMVFVRHVENFLAYLSSILYEVFTQRPATLRSSDKVDVSVVLQHESIEAVVRELAERKVDALSYSSFSDLNQFFQDRFNLEIASATHLKQIEEAIETRNISVHNRCLMNRRYVSRLKISEESIGARREIYVGDLDQLAPALFSVVKALDRSISKHLTLRGVLFASVNAERET